MFHEKAGKRGTRNRGRYQVLKVDWTDFTIYDIEKRFDGSWLARRLHMTKWK